MLVAVSDSFFFFAFPQVQQAPRESCPPSPRKALPRQQGAAALSPLSADPVRDTAPLFSSGDFAGSF